MICECVAEMSDGVCLYERHGKEVCFVFPGRRGVEMAWPGDSGGQEEQLRPIGTIAMRGLDAACIVDPSVLSFGIFAAGVFAVGLVPHLVVRLWNSCCWSIEFLGGDRAEMGYAYDKKYKEVALHESR